MKIIIDYDSSWRNSFLDGSNDEPLPKGGRAFLASFSSLNGLKSKPENFIAREITQSTVMGLLNRLLGDQRKLYQSRNDLKYYFKAIEDKVSFKDTPLERESSEIIYIRNMTGSTDQQSFTGAIKANDPVLSSDYSAEFWGVLALDFTDICNFIVSDFNVKNDIDLYPLRLAERIDAIDKLKLLEPTETIGNVLACLGNLYPDMSYIENNGKIKPIRFYAAALYIQYARLSEKYEMSSAKSSRGTISGFSKRGYNGRRDFLGRFTTGKAKVVWGNPYIKKGWGGEDAKKLTKASGQLEITIDVDQQKALEIKQMIENAGVSAFYLGKKGLAYVSKIRV